MRGCVKPLQCWFDKQTFFDKNIIGQPIKNLPLKKEAWCLNEICLALSFLQLGSVLGFADKYTA